MPILVSCDQCGRDYKLKSKLAGTRFRCRDCDNVLRIPYPDKVVEDEESADETARIDNLSWAPVPPMGGVLGLPPASKSESTSIRGATRERKRKWRNKKRVMFPWKKLLVGVVGLIITALLVKAALDYRKQRSQPGENQENTSPEEAAGNRDTTPGNGTGVTGPESQETPVVEINSGWRKYTLSDLPISILMPDEPKPLREPPGTMTPTGAAVAFPTESGGKFTLMSITSP